MLWLILWIAAFVVQLRLEQVQNEVQHLRVSVSEIHAVRVCVSVFACLSVCLPTRITSFPPPLSTYLHRYSPSPFWPSLHPLPASLLPLPLPPRGLTLPRRDLLRNDNATPRRCLQADDGAAGGAAGARHHGIAAEIAPGTDHPALDSIKQRNTHSNAACDRRRPRILALFPPGGCGCLPHRPVPTETNNVPYTLHFFRFRSLSAMTCLNLDPSSSCTTAAHTYSF